MLEWTGERFIPGAGSDWLHHEHVHRYRFAAALASRRRVLDLGSGEGYGAALLSGRARSVTGLDVDPEAVAHATERYAGEGVEFLVASATDVPLEDDSFDLVACFEVIEHVDDPGALLDEAARLLAPGGLLVGSTPDRDAYNALRSEPNPFHRTELSRAEFEGHLRRRFASVRLYGQRSVTASWIDDAGAPPGFDLACAPRPPIYWVAVAAIDGDAPDLGSALFVDPARQDGPS
jgi:O-antigen biosynthesis protein